MLITGCTNINCNVNTTNIFVQTMDPGAVLAAGCLHAASCDCDKLQEIDGVVAAEC